MSTTKYIRPMTLFETIGTMFRLYWKIFIPIIILNIIVDYLTVGIGIVFGIFVGPVLIMTSNAILGKQVKVWQSIKKGVSLGKLFQFAFVSVAYIIICLLIASGVSIALHRRTLGEFDFIYTYVSLTPLWIFIPMIMLLEKKGLGESIRRSLHMTRVNFRRIAEMDLFILVLSVLVLLLLRGLSEYLKFAEVFVQLMLFITVTGLNTLPYVFVYYEYRARYENFNEELLAQELGYQPIEEMMTV